MRHSEILFHGSRLKKARWGKSVWRKLRGSVIAIATYKMAGIFFWELFWTSLSGFLCLTFSIWSAISVSLELISRHLAITLDHEIPWSCMYRSERFSHSCKERRRFFSILNSLDVEATWYVRCNQSFWSEKSSLWIRFHYKLDAIWHFSFEVTMRHEFLWDSWKSHFSLGESIFIYEKK